MEIRKGVVAECNKEKGYAIVFSLDGDIVEVKTKGRVYKVGEEILFYERIKPREEKRWSRGRAYRYAAGLAAALLVFMSSPLSISDLGGILDKKVYAASVYVEGGKSNLKVSVNKDQEVISADALNQQAQIVLKEIKCSDGENISDFMNEYFKAAEKKGYLNPGEPVVISVAPSPELESKNIIKKIETISKANRIKAVAISVPDIVVKKAADLGLTPGKLVISLVAKATKDIPVNVPILKTVTVPELIKSVPAIIKVLPTYSEEELAQLAQQTTPKTTETASPESNQSKPSDTGAASTATNDPNDDQLDDRAESDRTSEDSSESNEPANRTGGSTQKEGQAQKEQTPGQTDQPKDNQAQGKQTQSDQPQQPDQAQPDQKQPDQKQPDQAQPDQKQPDQPQQPDQAQPDQKQPDQKQPDQAQPDQKQPDQKQPDQAQPDQKQPDQTSITTKISEVISGLIDKVFG